MNTGFRRSADRGFTLIELSIALTIFAVLAVSIYSTFHAGLKLWRRSIPLMENHECRMTFFSTVASDLKHATVYRKPVKGQPLSLTEPIVNFEGTSDRMVFRCLVRVYDPAHGFRMEPAKVSYRFDPAHKSVKRLVAGRAEGFEEANAKTAELLEGVEAKDFGFEYAYKGSSSDQDEAQVEWKNSWQEENTSRIPRGVAIRVGEFKKIVFIPTGELGQ